MREILFRGKRIDNGEWVEGYFTATKNYYYIMPVDFSISFKVDPSTVTEFTGLTDKNGKKIFEGDIVSDGGFSGIVVFDDKDDGAFLVIDPFAVDTDGEFFSGLIDREVMGNIHDDPELSEIVEEP